MQEKMQDLTKKDEYGTVLAEVAMNLTQSAAYAGISRDRARRLCQKFEIGSFVRSDGGASGQWFLTADEAETLRLRANDERPDGVLVSDISDELGIAPTVVREFARRQKLGKADKSFPGSPVVFTETEHALFVTAWTALEILRATSPHRRKITFLVSKETWAALTALAEQDKITRSEVAKGRLLAALAEEKWRKASNERDRALPVESKTRGKDKLFKS